LLEIAIYARNITHSGRVKERSEKLTCDPCML